MVLCPKCSGSGRFRIKQLVLNGAQLERALVDHGQCFTCKGTGKASEREAQLFKAAVARRRQPQVPA